MDAGDLIRGFLEALGESWANVVGTSGAPVFHRSSRKKEIPVDLKSDESALVVHVPKVLQAELYKLGDKFPFRMTKSLRGAYGDCAELTFWHREQKGVRLKAWIFIIPDAVSVHEHRDNSMGTSFALTEEDIRGDDAWAARVAQFLMNSFKPYNARPVYSAVYQVPPTDDIGVGSHVHREDGGQALVFSDSPVEEYKGDGHFFVSLHSWHDRPATFKGDLDHPIMRSLMGRKIRVTIETLD